MRNNLIPSGVIFDEISHRYFLGDKELQGITSTLIKRAYPDHYKTPERYTEEEWQAVLANAAERGTRIHKAIENYEENSDFDGSMELANYIGIKENNALMHLASEYIVTDGEHYASPIDLVFEDFDGNIVLADIKTTYRPYYDLVALQLSIYKRLFEMQNPGLKVSRCALIWLRESKYEYRELPVWGDDMLDGLFKADTEDKPYDIVSTYGDLPAQFAKVEDEIAKILLVEKSAKERKDELIRGLYETMEKHNVKTFEGGRIRLTRVLPTKAKTFDSKRFKEEHADLYKEYIKETEKSGSLRITLI